MNKLELWSRPMLAGKTRITVALSGGADSVCCLHFLKTQGEKMGFVVTAAHFHHKIRGAEADRDAEFCRALCAQWNIPLAIGTGDVPARAKETGESLEEAARIMRYGFFQKIGGVIATAHTANDNMETLLTNILRGTGLRGLCGIPPVRNQYIRPILCLTKAEVLTYLAKHNLPHVEDSTNGDLTTLRSRLRHEVIPLLEQENPSVADKSMELAARLREDEAFLTNLAIAHLNSARQEEGLSVPILRKAARPIFHRALLLFMAELGVMKPSSGHVRELEKLVLGDNPSAVLHLPGMEISRQYDLIFPQNPPKFTFSPQNRQMPFVLQLPQIGTFFCSETNPKIPCLVVSQNKIGNEILVRPRQIGDELTTQGGTKTVKKRMIDDKIPAHLRDGLPVLEHDGKVVAVWKLGVNPEYLPKENEKAWYFYFQ